MEVGELYPSEAIEYFRRSLIRIGAINKDFDGGVPAIDGFNFTEVQA